MVDHKALEEERLRLADERLAAVMARIQEQHPDVVLAPGAYTTDDLRAIEPCPICGVRASIVGGRLYRYCIREKHSPPKTFPKPELVPTPVQRSFEVNGRDWWND